MFGKKKKQWSPIDVEVMNIIDFKKKIHNTYDKIIQLKTVSEDQQMGIIKLHIPTFDEQTKQYRSQIQQIASDYFTQRRTAQEHPNVLLEQIGQVKMGGEEIKKKKDYIDEKSKLTEKQLLGEIILLLENIRNDAKINSEFVTAKLNTISSATLDSKYELKYMSEDTKKHRKDNTGPSWEF